MFIVIPCYKEPGLNKTLESLYMCNNPGLKVRVVVVINQAENCDIEIDALNKQTYNSAMQWLNRQSSTFIEVKFLKEILPSKDAGVGLARKIGMDYAAKCLIKENNPHGVIVCLDADCTVDPNYLIEIVQHFSKNPRSPASSIHFEHPLEGYMPQKVYEAILEYELHLRYYINALRFAGHPFAFHTIGSSMAVRADVYLKQGGMNKRKAGEDFYFLQKIIPLGHFTEITGTTVIPSPRISDRVPFGTGKAVGEFVKSEKQETYSFRTFYDLKVFIDHVQPIYHNHVNYLNLPESIIAFLEQHDFEKKIREIKANTTNFESFYNRFFRWFNAFMTLKYVHFARDHYYPNELVIPAVGYYFQEVLGIRQDLNATEMLNRFRQFDKKIK